MVILEEIVFGEIDVAERTPMMAIDCFVDAPATVNVAATRDVTVVDFVEADVAEKLLFKCAQTDLEIAITSFLSHSDKLLIKSMKWLNNHD